MKHLLLIFFFCTTFVSSFARVKLPEILGSGMVLQQNSNVLLWGDAKPDFKLKIKASWDSEMYIVKTDNVGKWRIYIKTPTAGGPYNISIADDEELTLTDILIGEVWVCSGQSNMAMPMKGFISQPVLKSNDILLDAGNNSLRMFQVKRAVSTIPQSLCEGQWKISSPGSASNFSAVGFQFAKKLQQILQIPVGIIEASWSSTPIESWMDKESIEAFSQRSMTVPDGSNGKADRFKATCIFNGMISPITGYVIKGFLWYQGESNVLRASEYKELMQLMVRGWRKSWKNDTLPFYYVQIAPWNYRHRKDSVPYLREAQFNALSLIPNSGMVVSMDKGSSSTIHPPDKTAISNRLLYWALGNTYQMSGIAYESPSLDKVVFKKDTAILTFKNAPNGFTSYDERIVGFEIARENRVFHDANGRIVKNRIQVSSKAVTNPVAVRYAFKDLIKTNLYSVEGLPVAPFRTDDW